MQYINEAKRFQKLAGIINESQLSEESLSPEEQKIADDILNTLDEGMFTDVLDKSETIKLFKKMAADVKKEYEASDKGMWEQNEKLKKMIKKIL
jgi:16S rRNA C1402 N4-methylase RsmH